MTKHINTGRVARVREYLNRVKTARSPKQILIAAAPEADMTAICQTLAYMARRGYALANGRGKGNVRYRIGPTPLLRPPAPKPVKAAQPRTRKSAINFHAAPGTVARIGDPRRAASDQISVDLAAFLKRGGQIEQLGTTQVFQLKDTFEDND